MAQTNADVRYTRAVLRLDRLVGAACALTFLVAASSARAEEPAASDGDGYYYTEYDRRWYGWQTLAIDVPVLAAFYAAETSGKNGLGLGSLGVFTVGSPVVHMAHDRLKPGVVSGFAHLLLPLGGLVLVRPLLSEDISKEKRTAMSMTVGGVAAISFDVAFLTFDETERVVELDNGGAWWTPQVGWTGRNGWVGVSGGF